MVNLAGTILFSNDAFNGIFDGALDQSLVEEPLQLVDPDPNDPETSIRSKGDTKDRKNVFKLKKL